MLEPKGLQILRKRDTKGVLTKRKLEQKRLFDRARQMGS